jgi:hypothetical protein
MSLQIIILNTNSQADGSFYISGVFWLTAPASLILPIPSFKSQVSNITASQLTELQNGNIVEVPFNTGLYASGTTLDDAKTDLQSLYDSAQTKLNNSTPPSTGFIGAVFDGASWSISSSPLYVPSQLVNVLQPKDNDGIPLVVSEPRSGSEAIYATHNFCDKTTWFGDSVRINDEVLTDSGDGYVFTSEHINWIDMRTGRILDDDGLVEEQKLLNPGDAHGYQVIVKSDGYLKTPHDIFESSGQDYEIFYDDGYVKFEQSQSGKTITASYSYENGSTFYVKPLSGKTLIIEAAEADFSDDIGQKDTIEYSIWGLVDVFAPQYLQSNGGPYPSGTKIPLKTGYYKRYTQILREAIGAYPALSANGALNEHKNLDIKEFRRKSRGVLRAMQSVPFRYATVRSLFSDYGMELRVRLLNNKVFEGDTSTITFYCTSQNKGS